MTAIEYFWVLYSDGRRSEKMVGCLILPRTRFLWQEIKVRGFEVQGGLGARNCNILVLHS